MWVALVPKESLTPGISVLGSLRMNVTSGVIVRGGWRGCMEGRGIHSCQRIYIMRSIDRSSEYCIIVCPLAPTCAHCPEEDIDIVCWHGEACMAAMELSVKVIIQ